MSKYALYIENLDSPQMTLLEVDTNLEWLKQRAEMFINNRIRSRDIYIDIVWTTPDGNESHIGYILEGSLFVENEQFVIEKQ